MKKESNKSVVRQADRQAWAAVLSCNVGKLDVALGKGADPDCSHPLGHSILDQAVKASTKASSMCAVLIERGATVPAPGHVLAFELVSRAILEDSPILAKQLMASGPDWPPYLKGQWGLCFSENAEQPSKLETFLNAVSACESIGNFNQSFSRKPGSAPMRPGR